jgi:hypothetical protein
VHVHDQVGAAGGADDVDLAVGGDRDDRAVGHDHAGPGVEHRVLGPGRAVRPRDDDGGRARVDDGQVDEDGADAGRRYAAAAGHLDGGDVTGVARAGRSADPGTRVEQLRRGGERHEVAAPPGGIRVGG